MSAGGLGIYTVELYLKVRLACSEGMTQRQAAKHFNISRDSVAKMLSYSVPPGYRRRSRVSRPKLDAFVATIDQWLDEDVKVPRKQRHTAKRVFDRLREECGFTGGYTIINVNGGAKPCHAAAQKQASCATSGERREGVARPEFRACGVGDFREGFSLPFGRGFGRGGSFRRSSRGC
jgi:hypothetical protein